MGGDTLDFYFECSECKTKVAASFNDPFLPKDQEVITSKGKASEISFRCYKHKQEEKNG